MKIEGHSLDFDIFHRFPNAREFKGFEGGGVYKAELHNKPFLIIDERTLADLLTEEDAEGLTFVKVIEFADEDERESYIARELQHGVDVG
jgi:hypothetical protein